MEYKILENGVKMPVLGYGVYQTPKIQTTRLVKEALELGYRHVDTAQNYSNEREVGRAIFESGISRQDIFVTTKTQSNGYENTFSGIDKSLDEFGYDYFDLILIHWPINDNIGTYHALEDALDEGKCKAIGLSNFNSTQFEDILDNCDVNPMVDQIETHLLWQQEKMHTYLTKRGCIHESWSPFASGNFNLFNDETLLDIASNYSKSVAQIILRFLIQKDIVVIPKSTSKVRMSENFNIFDFKLSDDEMDIIKEFDSNRSYCNWPYSMNKEK